MVKCGDCCRIAAAGVPGVAGPEVAGGALDVAEVAPPNVAKVAPPIVVEVAPIVAVGGGVVEGFETAYSAEAALADYWQSRTASNKLLPRLACVS